MEKDEKFAFDLVDFKKGPGAQLTHPTGYNSVSIPFSIFSLALSLHEMMHGFQAMGGLALEHLNIVKKNNEYIFKGSYIYGHEKIAYQVQYALDPESVNFEHRFYLHYVLIGGVFLEDKSVPVLEPFKIKVNSIHDIDLFWLNTAVDYNNKLLYPEQTAPNKKKETERETIRVIDPRYF